MGCPALSCDDILTRNPNALSGIYWIQRPSSSVMPVYCEMVGSEGWTMVFKISRNPPTSCNNCPGTDAWSLWNGTALNYNNTNFLNTAMSFSGVEFLLSDIVPKWNDANNKILQAKVNVYVKGLSVIHITFNATGTDRNSWFAPERVVYSPWSDIPKNSSSLNSTAGSFFSIGDKDPARLNRYFYIHNNYAACYGDAGWLAVDYGGPCYYEIYAGAPRILYSPFNTKVTWYDVPTPYTQIYADVFAVLIRFDETVPSNITCKLF